MKRIILGMLCLMGTLGSTWAQVFTGDLTLSTQAEVDAFNFVEVTGNLLISGGDIVNLNSMTSLVTVGGDLTVSNNPGLTSMIGLSNLVTVEDRLGVDGNGFSDVQGLNSLKQINGSVVIGPDITSFIGLESVERIFFLWLTSPNIVNFQGLNNVTEICSLRVDNSLTLVSVDGLESLSNVCIQIVLQNNPNLENLDALSNSSGAINVGVIGNPKLQSLCPLTGHLNTATFQISNNGTSTSSTDDLTMGCPVVTLRGSAFINEVGICAKSVASVPIANQQVVFTDGANGKMYFGYTDNNGNYEIFLPNEGEYTVSAVTDISSNWELENDFCPLGNPFNYTPGEFPGPDLVFVRKTNAELCDATLDLTHNSETCPGRVSEACAVVTNRAATELSAGVPIEFVLFDGRVVTKNLSKSLVSGETHQECVQYDIDLFAMSPFITSATLKLTELSGDNLLDATYTNIFGNPDPVFGNPYFDATTSLLPAQCPNLTEIGTAVEAAILGVGNMVRASNFMNCGEFPAASGISGEQTFRIDEEFNGIMGDGAFMVVNRPFDADNGDPGLIYLMSLPSSVFDPSSDYQLSFDYRHIQDPSQPTAAGNTSPAIEVLTSGSKVNDEFLVVGDSWNKKSYTFNGGINYLFISFAEEHAGMIAIDNIRLVKVDCNNNVATTLQSPDCAFDPNDLTVIPEGCGDGNFVLPDQELTYRVRFENVGPGPAFNVVLKDQIDENLDLSTLRLINSSHEITSFSVNGDRLLEIKFDGIDLPGFQFSPLSKGYVTFAITPKQGIPLETMITNQVSIIFNTNIAITTNLVSNTIREELFADPSFTFDVQCDSTVNFVPDVILPELAYSWLFESGGVSSTSTSAIVNNVAFEEGGVNFATLNVSKDGCVSTDLHHIIIPDPSLDCGIECNLGEPVTICAGESTVLNTDNLCGTADPDNQGGNCNTIPVEPPVGVDCESCTNSISGLGNVTVNVGEKVCVLAGESFSGSLTMNGGTLVVCGSFLPTNFAFNAGDVFVLGDAVISTLNVNSATSIFMNFGNVTIDNAAIGGMFENHGTLTVSANLNQNNGVIVNTVVLNVLANFVVNAQLNNTGTIIVEGTLLNNSGNITNECSITGTVVGISIPSPTANLTYTWLPVIGLSNATVANPIATPTSTTEYTVTVTNLDNNTESTGSVLVTVDENCQVCTNPGEISGPASICPGQQDVVFNICVTDEVTNVSAWGNGVSSTTVPVDGTPVTVDFGTWLSPGSSTSITVGVNLSQAPWYQQSTLALDVVACGAREGVLEGGWVTSISPNPFTNSAELFLEGITASTDVFVKDVNGRVVEQKTIDESGKLVIAEELPAGLYIVQINGIAYRIVKAQ